jgi:hypothetical protein
MIEKILGGDGAATSLSDPLGPTVVRQPPPSVAAEAAPMFADVGLDLDRQVDRMVAEAAQQLGGAERSLSDADRCVRRYRAAGRQRLGARGATRRFRDRSGRLRTGGAVILPRVGCSDSDLSDAARGWIGPSLTQVHERKDLDPSRPLRQVYYRGRRELPLMAASIQHRTKPGPSGDEPARSTRRRRRAHRPRTACRICRARRSFASSIQ